MGVEQGDEGSPSRPLLRQNLVAVAVAAAAEAAATVRLRPESTGDLPQKLLQASCGPAAHPNEAMLNPIRCRDTLLPRSAVGRERREVERRLLAQYAGGHDLRRNWREQNTVAVVPAHQDQPLRRARTQQR